MKRIIRCASVRLRLFLLELCRALKAANSTDAGIEVGISLVRRIEAVCAWAHREVVGTVDRGRPQSVCQKLRSDECLAVVGIRADEHNCAVMHPLI